MSQGKVQEWYENAILTEFILFQYLIGQKRDNCFDIQDKSLIVEAR